LDLCRGQNKNKKEKEDNLLLLFAFFFLLAFGVLEDSNNVLDKVEKAKTTTNEHNLFLFCKEEGTRETGGVLLADNNTILSSSSPYFVDIQVLGTKSGENREDIISYQIEKGDTVLSVAEKFSVSADTIKWANDIKSNTLKEGEELLILPITGVIYYVEKGDTVGGIAKMHQADVEEIISFNKIENKKIISGDRLIIPNGKMPVIPKITISSNSTSSSFINPVPGGIITQRVHSYNAVDIYNICGSKIVSSASGKVISTGWGSWPAGNFVKIDHGSVVILYAHLQNIYVKTGDLVYKGQQIGTVGNTGKTIGKTGCHLHFDVLSRKIRNPFAHLSIGARL
jgi:murein DD-endopeptidase MepM/ murein hydrolase activator NlpD